MKLYIGNLSFQTQENELADLFAELGEVTSAKIITDRDTGRSKGFGFVEYADRQAGEEAISKLDGYQFDGRNIKVSEAREREENRGPRRPSGGGGGFNRNR